MTTERVLPIYERIGGGYAARRRADPDWLTRIHTTLASDSCLLNVGAGSGSYEPTDRMVVALEPSELMIAQRPPGSAPVVRGRAERLPFADRCFDAALAVLTVHHWDDPEAGLAEISRVAAKQVVVTWDPSVFASEFWLVRDYLPEAANREQGLATISTVQHCLRNAVSTPMPVPFGCTDGFFAAYWRRPHAYLDERVRNAISGLALLDQRLVKSAMRRLASDLDDGSWYERYSALTGLEELDLGYRIVVAES
jgi:SAM-dependent methyltransferase